MSQELMPACSTKAIPLNLICSIKLMSRTLFLDSKFTEWAEQSQGFIQVSESSNCCHASF